MVQEIKDLAGFEAEIAKEQLTIVDFTATWCGPCQRIKPIFEKMAEENPEVNFIKVDVDENSEASEKAGVSCMPTFHFYKKGVQYDELEGADADAIKEKMNNILNGTTKPMKAFEECDKITEIKCKADYEKEVEKECVTVCAFIVRKDQDCKKFSQDIKELAEAKPEINFIYIEPMTQATGEIAVKEQVPTVPFFKIYKSNKVYKEFKTESKQELEENISYALDPNSKSLPDPVEVELLDSIEKFKEQIKSETITIIDFAATWCPPCKRVAPMLDKLNGQFIEENKPVKICKFYCDKVEGIAKEAGVKCYPTFKIYKNGEEVHKVEGADLESVKSKINELIKS